MAVFLIIPPHILSSIFIFTCVMTILSVLRTDYGSKNMFSVLINGIFVCLLSIIYAYRTYHTRLSGVYDKMIIDDKNRRLSEVSKELEILTVTDPLTGLGNRRYLTDTVRPLLEKYGKLMGSLAIMFLDIDNFKNHNDRYGHNHGDLCLKAVAKMLSDFSSENDFHAVRYGGEEFVLVMTGLSLDSVCDKAEQLRKSISGLEVRDGLGLVTSVTVSIGISYHDTYKHSLLKTAVAEADNALYDAKQNGRNRVVVYDSESSDALVNS